MEGYCSSNMLKVLPKDTGKTAGAEAFLWSNTHRNFCDDDVMYPESVDGSIIIPVEFNFGDSLAVRLACCQVQAAVN